MHAGDGALGMEFRQTFPMHLSPRFLTPLLLLSLYFFVGCKMRMSHVPATESDQDLGGTSAGRPIINGETYHMLIMRGVSEQHGQATYAIFIKGDGIEEWAVSEDVVSVNKISKIPVKRGYMTLLSFNGELTKLAELPTVALPVENEETFAQYEKRCVESLILQSEKKTK